LTSKLLTKNPEYYTVWNYRRLILQHLFSGKSQDKDGNESERSQTIQQYIKSDLLFLIPLLLGFPKCYWIWNHRQWLLEQSSEQLPRDEARQIWQEELALCSKMLMRDNRNFHAWSYRRFVVQNLEQLSEGPSKTMTKEEFDYTTKMIHNNLSNFSAWHNRSNLIPRLLNEQSANDAERREMLASEFDLISQALNTDPYDQSLWFYHQYLIYTLNSKCPHDRAVVLTLSDQDRLNRLQTEIIAIKEILEDTTDCKWIYQSLLSYNTMYLEIDPSTDFVSTTDMRGWLEHLRQLDPLRKGRWDDLEKSLNI
jgi:geranylgeranyl transferase type-2 subunit alpha